MGYQVGTGCGSSIAPKTDLTQPQKQTQCSLQTHSSPQPGSQGNSCPGAGSAKPCTQHICSLHCITTPCCLRSIGTGPWAATALAFYNDSHHCPPAPHNQQGQEQSSGCGCIPGMQEAARTPTGDTQCRKLRGCSARKWRWRGPGRSHDHLAQHLPTMARTQSPLPTWHLLVTSPPAAWSPILGSSPCKGIALLCQMPNAPRCHHHAPTEDSANFHVGRDPWASSFSGTHRQPMGRPSSLIQFPHGVPFCSQIAQRQLGCRRFNILSQLPALITIMRDCYNIHRNVL